MKRIKWLIVCLLAGIVTDVPGIRAQQLGITGGLNIANLSGKIYRMPAYGSVIGGFIRWDIAGGLKLQPEILFSMKGGKESIGGPGYATLSMNYVEVPVLLRMNLFSLPVVPAGFDVFAGPDFAFNVYSDQKYLSYNQSRTVVVSNSLSGLIRPFDFNVAVGGGPNFNLGPMTLGVELRYTFGTGSAFHGGDSWNNNVWSIMASAAF